MAYSLYTCRAEAELRLLHKEVTKKVSRLQAAVNEQEASHLVRLPIGDGYCLTLTLSKGQISCQSCQPSK
jgi:hypothetical protein